MDYLALLREADEGVSDHDRDSPAVGSGNSHPSGINNGGQSPSLSHDENDDDDDDDNAAAATSSSADKPKKTGPSSKPAGAKRPKPASGKGRQPKKPRVANEVAQLAMWAGDPATATALPAGGPIGPPVSGSGRALRCRDSSSPQAPAVAATPGPTSSTSLALPAPSSPFILPSAEGWYKKLANLKKDTIASAASQLGLPPGDADSQRGALMQVCGTASITYDADARTLSISDFVPSPGQPFASPAPAAQE